MALGDKTSTFTADNIGDPEPVMVNSHQCKEVTVKENAGANTASFKIHEPLKTSPAIIKALGDTHTFKNPDSFWSYGAIVGYIETANVASATFSQEEK